MDGNHSDSVCAQASLTVRTTIRSDTKVGASDPLSVTFVTRMWDRQRKRIKVTLGITGLSRPIVHIDGAVWHLDVGSSYPGGGAPSKGSAVRRLKWYASWVQNVNNIAFYYCKVVIY